MLICFIIEIVCVITKKLCNKLSNWNVLLVELCIITILSFWTFLEISCFGLERVTHSWIIFPYLNIQKVPYFYANEFTNPCRNNWFIFGPKMDASTLSTKLCFLFWPILLRTFGSSWSIIFIKSSYRSTWYKKNLSFKSVSGKFHSELI